MGKYKYSKHFDIKEPLKKTRNEIKETLRNLIS